MSTFYIQDIPADLFRQLQRLAKAQGRSLNTQVIVLLIQALKMGKEEDRKIQAKALASIHKRRFIAPKNSPSSLALLHEDHNR